MYEAENSKICNFWTFWPVIQVVNHFFKIRQKAFRPKCPEVLYLPHALHVSLINTNLQSRAKVAEL